VGAIQRSLLQLTSQGGDHFFGEPALELNDFLHVDESARGLVNILAADRLMSSPRLYSTFLLWLLSELFEQLPEVGDQPKPKLCFFFDEAHLLFEDAPPALLEKVEQVVRLIRSKGVGVYFITQNPIDIPDTVAGQLGNRVQHALRAFTPRDQAAVKSAAETFRPNPAIDVTSAITELKVGEALVSLLQPDGSPTPVQRTLIKPPASRVGPLTPEERKVLITTDEIGSRYDVAVDRESAQEMLAAKAGEAAAAAAAAKAQSEAEKAAAEQARSDAVAARDALKLQREQERLAAQRAREEQRAADRAAKEAARPSMTDKMMQSAGRAVASSVGRQLGNQLLRGILGGLFRGR
jgi:DNA helicase HerA-like ATPase